MPRIKKTRSAVSAPGAAKPNAPAASAAKVPATPATSAPAPAKIPAQTAPAAAPATPAPAKTPAKNASAVTREERHRMIAEAAYYIALRKGFQSDPRANWLEAEAEIDARLKSEGRA